jgi:isopenicillin-N epimerase
VHLNHGAYGTVPRTVQEAQRRLRIAAEANPHRFHKVVVPHGIAEARAAAAEFLGLDADAVVLMRNVTEAITTVLASLELGVGDELVISDHGYGAVRLAAQAWCERSGARLAVARVPLDGGPDEAVAAFEAVLSSRTRLVVVDHITSPTGLIFPVGSVAAAARRHGSPVFVDAAHVPGQLETHPAECGGDFWVGNFHKWAFAARGTAAVWIAPTWRDRIHPLVTGWNHRQPFPLPFDARGTDDFSAWMSLPYALTAWSDLGGWTIAERNSAMVDAGLEVVSGALGVTPVRTRLAPAPALRLLPLPSGMAVDPAAAEELYERLSQQYRIETLVLAWGGRGFIRLTAQLYNTPGDYERLADALVAQRPG